MNEQEMLSDEGEEGIAYQANQARINAMMHNKMLSPKLAGSLTAGSS